MRKIGSTTSITTGIVPAVPGLPYVIRAYILAARTNRYGASKYINEGPVNF